MNAIRITFAYVDGSSETYAPPHARDNSPAAKSARHAIARKMRQRLGLGR
ncbi:hypothetical protein Ql52_gp006 [Caulobacter phage Quill_5.2]|uniref:Uncharacterized protein n=1 Tax=Caulobacter phage Quill_5.2 TaxID=3075108 RepID=A0AA96Q138_9CAUD|nr:hypothetical protein Ql52_gp006 [Caulobacter phage Quill_5.2]